MHQAGVWLAALSLLVPAGSAALPGGPPPAADEESAAEEWARSSAELVEGLEDLAVWCHRRKLYGSRDDVYEALLTLDPEHKKARRTLRYNRKADGTWERSPQYRVPKDRNDEALPELYERRSATVARHVDAGLAWLERGEDALPAEVARGWAAQIDALLPPDGARRERFAATWDLVLGSWPSAETTAEPGAVELESSGVPAPAAVALAGHPLEIRLGAFGPELFAHERPGRHEGRWVGELDGHALDVLVYVRESTGLDGRLSEPEDAVELFEGPEGNDEWPGFLRRSWEILPGPFGHSGNACLARGPLRGERDAAGHAYVLGGLLERGAWALAVACTPPPTPAVERAVVAFLRAAAEWSGPLRDRSWTDEETEARWRASAPEGAEYEMEGVIRTDHYIVLGNSDGGRLFGEKMEECYEEIRSIFPFDEVEGRRLMPVFLLRTREQYNQLVAKVTGLSVGQARRSGGVASRDFYATWYEAPGDPVHVHEATHQIFRNRLRLSGAGSWFQEGVAEYVETRANQRGGAARAVRKREHRPLRDLFAIPSLLLSAGESVRGGSEAGDNYALAALLIEFLRESDWGEDGFLDFVRAVGTVRPNDVDRIAATIRDVYGATIEEMEEAWVEYCTAER